VTEADAPQILVVGSGSIGRRHVSNLVALGARVTSMDPDEARAIATDAHEFRPFDLSALDAYEGIVIAGPSNIHGSQTAAALRAGAKVLVEKPLTTDVDELDSLLRDDAGHRIMVGFNLRLHEPIRRVVEAVRSGSIGHPHIVRLWFGSWLPDWRPAVDYRTTYSAHRELGGGVLNDAIHELDLLIWLAGSGHFEVVGAIVDCVGPLEIDVEDTVVAALQHESGLVASVSLDYLSRCYRRGMEIVGDERTIRFDWARNVIELEDGTGIRSEHVDVPIAESYREEASAFLDFVTGKSSPPVDGNVAAESVRIAAAIRRAAHP